MQHYYAKPNNNPIKTGIYNVNVYYNGYYNEQEPVKVESHENGAYKLTRTNNNSDYLDPLKQILKFTPCSCGKKDVPILNTFGKLVNLMPLIIKNDTFDAAPGLGKQKIIAGGLGTVKPHFIIATAQDINFNIALGNMEFHSTR